MALALLSEIAAIKLPLTVIARADVQKVSRLVFAGLVEARFRTLSGQPTGYCDPLEATVTAITPEGWLSLGSRQ
ncbi:hypothetical protein [Variovorax sp. UC122_21]|uniref:hypothetical protein n=1 Tax=Variovorax TaxID=34072 RepID=UPI00193421AD|nr:hypothetical protein INQ48_35825 [Variovorax paradoxus]